MAIGVLGPVVVDDGTPLSPRDRVVLSALVVRRGEVVAADQLADALWPGDPPDSWRKVVQSAVVRLRKVLGPALIQTAPGGYRLAAGEDDVDAWRFERLVRRAVELAEFGEHDRASEAFERATALWRGEPFADLDGWAPGAAEASRLLELRRLADERAVEARLALGEHRDVVARATSLVAAEPLREQRWGLLATALYRAGRQGEALRVLHDARRVLGDQLGVEPGAELVDLEQAILQQDAALAAPAVTRSRAGAHQPCPYKGLEAYGERDAETFFGRESEIATCRQRMAGGGFLDPGTLRPRGAALPGALGGVYNFRFSADGNRLLIQSGDRTLRLVDVPTRTIIGDPIPIGETVDLFLNERQLLRADGKEIAAELDDNVAIWDLEPADWIGAACKVAGRNLTREEWTRYLGAFGAYHRTCPA